MISLGQDQKPDCYAPSRRRTSPGRAAAGSGSHGLQDEVCPIRTVVVDDSPGVLKLLSTFLEQQRDFQLVGTATDGRNAVRRVVELRPDLVLMDMQLPGMNGLEATRLIKACSEAPAVIMVTADDTPECRAQARAAGTDAFVGKLHMFSQLRTALRRLFPGRRL
jgi:DNA-binding NarL/FixJ family response regulator